MRPARTVYLAAQAITPFIGKGNPRFIGPEHPDFGKKENPTLEEHLAAAVRQVFERYRIDPALVQRGYVGNFAGEVSFGAGSSW